MVFSRSLGTERHRFSAVPINVSALARMEVPVLSLGILIAQKVIKSPRDKTHTSILASALTLTGTALNRCRRVQKSPRERLKTIPEVGSEKLMDPVKCRVNSALRHRQMCARAHYSCTSRHIEGK